MVSASSVCGVVSSALLPAGEIGGDLAQRRARLRLQLVAFGEFGGGLQHRHAAARARCRGSARMVASPRPRFGTLTMRSKARSSAPLRDDAEIGHARRGFPAARRSAGRR